MLLKICLYFSNIVSSFFILRVLLFLFSPCCFPYETGPGKNGRAGVTLDPKTGAGIVSEEQVFFRQGVVLLQLLEYSLDDLREMD